MRNLKKVIALVAVFAMMVSTVAFAQTFTDVDAEHDYYEAIEMLSNLNILTGDDQDGDGKLDFRPEDKITRAEVAAIISRIQGINSAAQVATDFADVPSTHWASGYVAQAAGQGIVNGYGDGNFGPEDNVLYEQAVKMFVEALGYAPFVEANGGYYTGHLTAAQRYGISEGVIGGAPGVEATRGQIAQLAYNAIDTPLMDRYTYGADAEFMIFDGKGNRDFMTLLTRDLGVKKFTAILNENQVTDFDAHNAIDTDEEATVAFDWETAYGEGRAGELGTDYRNYKLAEVENGTVLEGDSNASALIGYEVEVYVKEVGKKEYEIISIAATSKNDVKEISIADFVKFENNKIEYWKNASDRTTSEITVDLDAVFVNGVAIGADDTAAVWSKLNTDKTYSGSITVLDNGSKKMPNVVFIDVNTALVVKDVSASGKVTFYNPTNKSVDNKTIRLVFDEENKNQIIKLTKGGEAIDYTELNEWDVLSVLANNDNDYYVVEVIEEGKVEGSISTKVASKTSEGGSKYTIGADSYDIAKGAYNCSKLTPGDAGIFYIDNYGKIVAYDETGSSVASDKYAYIISAVTVEDTWNAEQSRVKVQILDKSGEIYEAYLADPVTFEYPTTAVEGDLGVTFVDNEYEFEDMATSQAEAVAGAIKNNLVTYEANAQGEIKTLTFAGSTEGEDGNTLYLTDNGAADYDVKDASIEVGGSTVDVDEDTIVFYITNSAGNVWVDGSGVVNAADPTMSKVDTVASLSNGEYAYAELYDTEDIAGVIVLYNTKGGIDTLGSIAFVDSVGTAINGDEVVKAVTFFKDGQKYTAYTDADLNASGIVAGNAYRFAMSADGTVITSFNTVATIDADRTVIVGEGDDAEEVQYAGELGEVTWAPGDAGTLVYGGPVVGFNTKGDAIRYSIKEMVGDELVYNLGSYEPIKVADANVYVFDPVRTSNKISVGDIADADYDTEIIEQEDGILASSAPADAENFIVDANELALGMMDFVLAFENSEDDITDVIIFKSYDFGSKYYVK